MILTGETLYKCARQEFLKGILLRLIRAGVTVPPALRLLTTVEVPVVMETEAVVDPIKAYINHSRWVVDCPDCPGAELLWKDDLTFICLSCFNAQHEHKAVKVILPKQKKAIEVLLDKRPLTKNRNWKHPETVKDLAQQNQEEGVT